MYPNYSKNKPKTLSSSKKKSNNITYNIAQMMLRIALPLYKTIHLEWGRGTGKSTALGGVIKRIILDMPRSSTMLIGESYQQILTRTLPSTVLGLEQHGLIQNVHYFIGRSAPRSWGWPQAYQPPKDYSRYIQFWNGSGIHLVSQDKKGDGRGLNTDAQIGDEAALLNKDLLDENTSPTLRGSNTKAFKGKVMFGKSVFASSTPLTLEGKWFTDFEQLAYSNPKEYYFLKANYRCNLENLREGYIEDAKRNTIPWIFDAEYENIRPNRTTGSYYALLNEKKHTYLDWNYDHYTGMDSTKNSKGDKDCHPRLPLEIGLDFGAVINSCVVNQELLSSKEQKALKSFYVLGDNEQTQDDLADELCDYYEPHQEKVIYMWYDNDGNNRTGNSKLTKSEQFADRLRSKGWIVHMMTEGGANMSHDLKHRLWEVLLRGDHPDLPAYSMNRSNCSDLYLSMSNAKAIVDHSTGRTRKNKSSERSKKVPRQWATDLSDAQDSIIVGKYLWVLEDQYGMLPN
jgi:hypothetical protein